MKYCELFKKAKPIIGMVHLAGGNVISRAIRELCVYESAGIDGVIVENYHSDACIVEKLLSDIQTCEYELTFGVNILGNNPLSFALAEKYEFVKFIQVDAISGDYESRQNDYSLIEALKKDTDILLMGGVWPKYYTPAKGSNLEKDLIDAKSRCEAVVVTGKGTGVETSLDKIKSFRNILGDYPLIIGAGINDKNFCEQMKIADACIVGSYFKGGDTHNEIIEEKVKNLAKIRDDNF